MITPPLRALFSRCLPNLVFTAFLFVPGLSSLGDEVRFGRDVLPILSDRCFHCHGPDPSHREADLRLDLEEDALGDRGGYAAIVAGDPKASEAFQRIATEDEDMVMPPVDSHRKPLTEKEAETIRQWIESGAKWGKHWAFEKPVRPEVPEGASNPIDAFVRKRLAEEGGKNGIEPAEQAPAHTRARRLAFDLTGLPPQAEQVQQLTASDTPEKYEALVDQLLASSHYGERMAMWWLDAARYSDTDGFQQDETRNNWPWRDWVIKAFNENKPFDQFTIEQFAGDLLPNATTEQKLATCFHRNHQTNGEGGRDREESRIDYVIDRVNTTGTVWLGLTLGCSQCHSHKFDPISQKEYYQLSAFFNSIDETGAAGEKATPYLTYNSPHTDELVEKAKQLVKDRRVEETKQEKLAEPVFEKWLGDQVLRTRSGHNSWTALHAESLASLHGTKLTQLKDGSVKASGPNPVSEEYRVIAHSPVESITGARLEVLPDRDNTNGLLSRSSTGEFVLTCFKLQIRREGSVQLREIEIARAQADLEEKASDEKYGKVSGIIPDDPRDGWTVSAQQSNEPHQAIVTFSQDIKIDPGDQLIFSLTHASHYHGANMGRFRLSVSSEPASVLSPKKPTPLQELASADIDSIEQVPGDLRTRLRKQFLADYQPYQEAKRAADMASKQLSRLESLAGDVKVMVLSEREKPRNSFVLERGVWDQHGDQVEPGVPDAVLPWTNDETRSRLDLANWIVSPENPLTARVIVNQLWQICFGAGLVRTPDDFGLQGEIPTHPDLLDWLAIEFIESGWDLKHILRLIVTSETYQQSSVLSEQLLEIDPKNELLARGARHRLPSWMLRDAALATAGLLDDSFGGPPIMPYQPEGVWDDLFKGKYSYDTSQGPLQFRRTVYAFWRRAMSPTYLFDVAPRRICEVRVRRTNTPLHALTLMNDRSQLEAARALGAQMAESDKQGDARIGELFFKVLSREPTPGELKVLRESLDKWLQHYQQAPDEADELLSFGQPEKYVAEKQAETAAYMVLASLILNSDEALTHE